jgi:cysteinyl-tRNA synthetase
MSLKFYNTLTRSLDPFLPLEEGKVRIYACGPTVYAHAHIGNFRSFMAFDLLHRYLEWKGFEVRFVRNFTDVDDKTIAGANREGMTIAEFTPPFARDILEQEKILGIRPVDAYPQATDYIDQMIEWVRRLEEKGLAYVTDDGSVWFSISKFPEYGKLSRIDPDAVRSGDRVASDEYEKDDVRDFALWKAAKPEDETAGAAWDSPWGRGRPGWHLECSVMSITELGETLDIHLGGEDLVFPHHEDEIAQSEGVTGKPFARFWLHVKHLLVEGQKMSKSLGNTYTVPQLMGMGHSAASIRHQLLSAQYRRELNFTLDGLEASARAVQRLVDFRDRLREIPGDEQAGTSALPELAREALAGFEAAMDDDLNSAEALGAVFTFLNRVNAEVDRTGGRVTAGDRDAALHALAAIDQVLGLLEVADGERTVDDDLAQWVESLIQERVEARQSRDFARADAIRDELAEKKVVLEDSAEGTRWKVVR